MLFLDSDIRMVADENLNKVIRTQGESNFSKILVELFKEVKKNGGSRWVIHKYISVQFIINYFPVLRYSIYT